MLPKIVTPFHPLVEKESVRLNAIPDEVLGCSFSAKLQTLKRSADRQEAGRDLPVAVADQAAVHDA